jgi:ABC-type branched-subunit amino acid transport system ATPase component/ABC-type branched-subunit amino acid transport system permease subunit
MTATDLTTGRTRALNVATALLVVLVLPPLTASAMPHLLTGTNALIGCEAVGFVIAALSLNVLLGYAGQISLGHAAFLGVGALAAGEITSQANMPMAMGFPTAVVVSALVSLVIGLPALRLRGLYLAIVTISFAAALQYTILPAVTGGSAAVGLPRRIWGSHLLLDNAAYLDVCLVILVGVWLVDVNLTRTRTGRALQALRQNEEVAQSFGIATTRYKLLAFVLSGGMAGLGGAVYGYAVGSVSSETFQFSQSLLLVTMVMVGGSGLRLPVLVSATLFWVLPDVITGLQGWEYVIGAAGLMLTVAFHPQGLGDFFTAHRKPPPVSDDDVEEELPKLPQLPRPSGLAAPEPVVGPLLEVIDVSVRFGGLQAVDRASFVVMPNTIVGLIGPNGAGKSTLFNTISGLVVPDAGTIRFRGEPITGLRPDLRARLGIARSFQQIGLARDLSVFENFLLAQHPLARYGDAGALLASRRSVRSERELRERAREAIAALGFEQFTDLPVKLLSGGQQRIVEIGCLLVTAPELVLLDEPSAGMSPGAAENLAERLRDVRDELGRTILLIEHNVPLVLDTCDEVYVLDAGVVIASGEPQDIASLPVVVDAYFGAAVST